MAKPQLGILHFSDGSSMTYDLSRVGSSEFWDTGIGDKLVVDDPGTTVAQKEFISGQEKFRAIEQN